MDPAVLNHIKKAVQESNKQAVSNASKIQVVLDSVPILNVHDLHFWDFYEDSTLNDKN